MESESKEYKCRRCKNPYLTIDRSMFALCDECESQPNITIPEVFGYSKDLPHKPQTLHCTASIPELGQLKTIINKLNRIERQNKKIFKKLDKLQNTSDNIDVLCHAICYTIDELSD